MQSDADTAPVPKIETSPELTTEKHVIAKISFPDFDHDDVDTWFLCLEAAFFVNDVKSDRQKFNTVIVALGNRAKYMYTAIAKCNKPDATDRYATLKSAVLEYFQPSENQRLTSLLSGVSLACKRDRIMAIFINFIGLMADLAVVMVTGAIFETVI
uniref:DUF7041 domain-containing protein n=1 Tax=Anopheles dirus TaxID=7168 RepID=A0A182NME7_9DIPT